MSHYVMVCGGRDYDAREEVEHVIGWLKAFYQDDLRVLHGDAKGLDTLVAQTCKKLGIGCKAFPAKWRVDGKVDKAAGFKRNQHMVDLIKAWAKTGHTAQVIAFPGGNGTKHASDAAEMAGLPVDYMPK